MSGQGISDLRPLSILLIEDNDEFVDIFNTACKLLDIYVTVEVTNKLSEGLIILGNWETDVVILDLQLADSSVENTISHITYINRFAPIVILSNNDQEDIPLLSIQEGAQQFIRKTEFMSNIVDRLEIELQAALIRHHRQNPETRVLKELHKISWVIKEGVDEVI